MNLEFDQKVSLAIACGLNPQFASALRVLGKIRNIFSHNLDSSLGKQQVKNLYEAFPAESKKLIQRSYYRTAENVTKPDQEKFEQLRSKDQFILLVVALDAILLVTINSARKRLQG